MSSVMMEYAHLSERVKTLQHELVKIAEHNRKYFTKRKHTPAENSQHKELRERVFQIRAELCALIEKSMQRAA